MTNFFANVIRDDKKPSLEEFKNDFEKAEYLQKLLINRSTSDGPAYDDHYIALRRHFLSLNETTNILPSFVKSNRTLDQFWEFIKIKFPTYAERRNYIWGEFNHLLDHLEGTRNMPHADSVDDILQNFNSEHIQEYWAKALERKEDDPEGAITISRTLIESVLKHILEELKVEYNNNSDLHEIYKLVTMELNLAPEHHDVMVFKQILGGCSAIVNGLGSLRNRHGDAHGKGREKYYKPSKRHAELAVNLAGSMCLFLIQTLQRSEKMKEF